MSSVPNDRASANTKSRSNSASPRLLSTLGEDVRIVTQDVMRRGVSRSVGGTLANLEEFYLSREDRARLQELSGVRRFFRRIAWFVRGLLMKLTPARRILLAAAIACFLFGLDRIDVDTVHVSLRLHFLGGLLLFAVLGLELKDKLVARDELEAGRAVQLALLPTEQPIVPGWDIWLYTRPANDVGGDLVDHMPLDDGKHAVLLGDVTGKALPAALLSVKLQATIRALVPYFDNLGDLAAGLNRILYRDGLPTRFASLVYCMLTPHSGQVRLLNAGHMPPLVVRGGTVTPMARGNMVIGIMPDVPFSEQQAQIERGDTVAVYSDGVSEAMNDEGDFFGDDRLAAVCAQIGGLAAADAGARIVAAVSNFVGDAAPSDDLSVMVMRRL